MEQALNKWTLAEKMIPDDPRILEAKANLFETQGRWEEAIESVEKAFQMSPKEASLPTYLAMYYWGRRCCSGSNRNVIYHPFMDVRKLAQNESII